MVLTSFFEKSSQVEQSIINILNLEITEDGLLSNIEDIYVGEKSDRFDYPSIWILEESTRPLEKGIGPKSTEIDESIYQFYCITYDPDDLEISRKESRELALKVMDTLEYHCLYKIDNEKVFDTITFESLEQTGNSLDSANYVNFYCLRVSFKYRRTRRYCKNTV